LYANKHEHTSLTCTITGWNQKGDKKKFLETGSSFPPAFQAILKKAPEDSLKVWTLLDLKVLPGWVNGNMALLGYAFRFFYSTITNAGAVTQPIPSYHIKLREELRQLKTLFRLLRFSHSEPRKRKSTIA